MSGAHTRRLILLASTTLMTACGATQTLTSDLVFTFKRQSCRSDPMTNFERFARDRGFDIFDKVRAAPIFGEIALMAVDVVAFQDGVMVEVGATPFNPNVVAVALKTRPPTTRRPELEAAIETYFAGEHGCELGELRRRQNDISARALFDSGYRNVQSWVARLRARSL